MGANTPSAENNMVFCISPVRVAPMNTPSNRNPQTDAKGSNQSQGKYCQAMVRTSSIPVSSAIKLRPPAMNRIVSSRDPQRDQRKAQRNTTIKRRLLFRPTASPRSEEHTSELQSRPH